MVLLNPNKQKIESPRKHKKIYINPVHIQGDTEAKSGISALLVSKSELSRFHDHIKEPEQIRQLAQKEAKRLNCLRQTTFEASKNWPDSVYSIQKRRRDEIKARAEQEEKDRTQFIKVLQAKRALERAKVVKEAKELLLQKNPQVRLINRALVLSECLRERKKQIEFRSEVKELLKKREENDVNYILKDIENYKTEEGKKKENIIRKRRQNLQELKKQITENGEHKKIVENSEFEKEVENLKNEIKNLEEFNEKEKSKKQEEKEKLRQIFLDSIRMKKEKEACDQKHQEYERQALQEIEKAKQEISEMTKSKIKEIRQRRSKVLDGLNSSYLENTSKGIKAREELEEKEIERRKKLLEEEDKKKKSLLQKRRLFLQKEMQEGIKALEKASKKQKKTEMKVKQWETLERLKWEKMDKESKIKSEEEEKKKKILYGEALKKQAAIQMEERKNFYSQDNATELANQTNVANAKFLNYAGSVLRNSEGVRPTLPIIKAIRQLYKELGMRPEEIKDGSDKKDNLNVIIDEKSNS